MPNPEILYTVYSYRDTHGTDWEIRVWQMDSGCYEANARLRVHETGYRNTEECDVWYGSTLTHDRRYTAVEEMVARIENAVRVDSSTIILVRK